MSANPFLVHVGDLLTAPGSERSHRVVTPVDWGIELSRITPEVPVEADLALISSSGGLMVRGTVVADVTHTCSRCLNESRQTSVIEIGELVEDGDEDDDEYHTTGDQLDLEPILRDAVLLAMPLLPRCDTGCEGLVTASETDLNTAAPGSADHTDSPFAALHDLFGPRD